MSCVTLHVTLKKGSIKGWGLLETRQIINAERLKVNHSACIMYVKRYIVIVTHNDFLRSHSSLLSLS